MRRREFVALAASGAVTAGAFRAHAQSNIRTAHIAVLTNVIESDSVGQARLHAFSQRLQELGWIKGQNLKIEVRWGQNNIELYRKYAAEFSTLKPDVIVAMTSPTVAALLQATRDIPIVFGGVIDPVGAGFVRNLARPGGNTTGFSLFEYSISAKWLELLREISPTVSRVAVVREAGIAAGIGQFAAIQAVAPNSLELSVFGPDSAKSIEEAVAAFAAPNSGLVVTATGFGANHPDLIPKIAANYKLPAVYPFRYLAEAGGLLSYGPNTITDWPRAAEYVDRLLKGAKPFELPVQAPTKYELVLNLRTARALGISVPPTLLARADEVIE